MTAVTSMAGEIATRSSNGDHSFANSLSSIKDLVDRLNYIATNIPADAQQKIDMLSKGQLGQRAMELLRHLVDTDNKMKVYEDVMARAKKQDERQPALGFPSEPDGRHQGGALR